MVCDLKVLTTGLNSAPTKVIRKALLSLPATDTGQSQVLLKISPVFNNNRQNLP